MKTTVFHHCDFAGRPYRIQDFREPLETTGVLPFVAGIGSFQRSHVWMLKLKTAEAKERLLAEGALEVKKLYCAVIEHNKRELAFKVHWVPIYVSNESVQKAFEDFGAVTDVTREQWNSPGLEDDNPAGLENREAMDFSQEPAGLIAVKRSHEESVGEKPK
ncbi:hypothetical protein V5799_023717, partial [Amblyomma americanum]